MDQWLNCIKPQFSQLGQNAWIVLVISLKKYGNAQLLIVHYTRIVWVADLIRQPWIP